MAAVRVFRYIEELDAFVVTDEFARLSDRLGLTEWHEAVWIGRLLLLDNDYGEHWFDNWDDRAELEERARAMGIESHRLMIVRPDKFVNGIDGPCSPPEIRKAFWTDVCRSLELSYDLLFAEARRVNAWNEEQWPEDFIPDLEERIAAIAAEADK